RALLSRLQGMVEMHETLALLEDPANFNESAQPIKTLVGLWQKRLPSSADHSAAVWDDLVDSRLTYMNDVVARYQEEASGQLTRNADQITLSEDAFYDLQSYQAEAHVQSLIDTAHAAAAQNNSAVCFKYIYLSQTNIKEDQDLAQDSRVLNPAQVERLEFNLYHVAMTSALSRLQTRGLPTQLFNILPQHYHRRQKVYVAPRWSIPVRTNVSTCIM
ncbi:hypothetical protein SARC_06332, partial [Sphaeroforma arctica JP610]